ncbi:MAG: hypothetical protein LBK95_01385, partial [Bifidobacteriaceae bacterium]|jgi:hypothetical protein|nr:hypothetical protein [Bifidobacteriaceae bacterium]
LAIEVFLLIAAFLPYAPPPPGVVIFGGGPMGPFLTVCYFPLFLAWQICAVGAARFIARVGQAAAAEAQVR